MALVTLVSVTRAAVGAPIQRYACGQLRCPETCLCARRATQLL